VGFVSSASAEDLPEACFEQNTKLMEGSNTMTISSVGTNLTEDYWKKRQEEEAANNSAASALSGVTEAAAVSDVSAVTAVSASAAAGNSTQDSALASTVSSNFDSFIASSGESESAGIYSITTGANGSISVVTDSTDDSDTELSTKQAQLKQLETKLLTCDDDEKDEIEQQITNLEKEISDLEDDEEE
jgi:CII-binding regulator of phage lambda lysogenization HflD